MVSSMGYVVLSGKMQLERQDTTLVTPISWAVCSTLSLILMLSLCEGVRLSLTCHITVKTQCRPFPQTRLLQQGSNRFSGNSLRLAFLTLMCCMAALSHQKVQVFPHVQIEAPDFRSQVDDMSGTVLLKHSPGLPDISVYVLTPHLFKLDRDRKKTYRFEKGLCNLSVPV